MIKKNVASYINSNFALIVDSSYSHLSFATFLQKLGWEMTELCRATT